jgi:DNA-binding transcriptional LysR family regulator
LLSFKYFLKMTVQTTLQHRLSQVRIRQLRMLVWLSEGFTLSAAADRLHITAAAASQMLGELESSVGTRLFERDRRGARPTPAGLLLAQRAAVMLQEFERFEQSVQSLGQQPLTLSLGVIPQVMIERVPQLAMRHGRKHPGSLLVKEGTSQALVEAVQNGSLAAAITRIGAAGVQRSSMHGLQVDLLGTEQAAIAVPRQHPLAQKRRIRPEDWQALGWVLPEPGSYIRNMLEEHFLLAQWGAPRCMLQVSTTVQALWCASQMGLAAAGPLALIRRFSADWQLKALPLALGEPIQLGLCYRPSQLQLPAFQDLREAALAG